MRIRKFPLFLTMLLLLAAVIALLPHILSSELFGALPLHDELVTLLNFVSQHYIPPMLTNTLGAYTIAGILGSWALFFLLTMNRPFFWWMVPYSSLFLYTTFLISQLRNGIAEPAALLERLSQEPTMGIILLVLALLLEITVFLLLTILSIRLNRVYRNKIAKRVVVNKKREPKQVKAKQRKQEKKAAKEVKKKKQERRTATLQAETDDDESTMVIVDPGEEGSTRPSAMNYPETSKDEIDADVPLTFPTIKELPRLKTIGTKGSEVEEGLYVGSVKMKDDESMLIADTPVEDLDEPQDAPPGKTYDPIPSLRKQMAEDARLAQMEVPAAMPQRPIVEEKTSVSAGPTPSITAETSEPKVLKEEPKPVEKIVTKAEVVPQSVSPLDDDVGEEDAEDMDLISGVGGLISSNAGSSALLSRNKLRYNFPSDDLLDTYPDHVTEIDAQTQEAGDNLIMTLKQFKIDATLMNIVKGPTVTMFEVSPAPGVRVSSIISLSDNIALQLAARQVRIVAPIPGKQAVGIEVPNKNRSIIGFKDLLPTIDAKSYQVPMILGRKITGEPVVIEITQSPHLLIAGATGSGKSVCVNSLISSILYRRSPKEVRLILVDPKIVELRVYNGIPHLLTPVITEPKKTIKALEFCLYEMDRRYKLLNALAVRNITAYNKKIIDLKLARERLPYIVVVIDEFADLMTTVGKELETLLARLAAMARAVGIHLVLATQRPSANVITGIIKSNIPTRIAFMVASQIDSRIIIDETGAEKLLGKGDMLFAPGWDPNSVRIQGAFLSDEEVERIVGYAKTQGEPDYLDEAFFEDEDNDSSDDDDDDSVDDSSDEALMEKALKIVVDRQSASASYLQRRLKIGYNRAARLVEQMEDDGIVGPARGSKPRELLKFPD